MPQQIRIFISSPADVPKERLRADFVIDKLAQDYSRYFALESYRWEYEAMLATGHFQDSIDPPHTFDIVVLILWSRLGTKLPDRFKGIDERAPVTGTEWEFEDALKAALARGAGPPDILAFRNVSPAPVETFNRAVQLNAVEQLNALDDFWTRHFANRGPFLTAYDTYTTLEQFAARLEQSLRRLIEKRIETIGNKAKPDIWLQSPFRGLEAYEFEHARIYFGRDALVAKAAEQLAGQARAGSAFLLVSGASGSGKSSLVKAALVPRLMKPQRIEGAAFVRRLVYRPSDGSHDVILGLVEALVRGPSSADLGLPELLGPGQEAKDLAAMLRVNAGQPGYFFTSALGRVAEACRKTGRILAYEEAKLILVIDQLEELFTIASIPAQDQRLFIALLAGLARSGSAWVIATIRSDFWHRAAEIPELLELCAGSGRIDIAVPSQAEIVEMIRKPADIADLHFEIDPATGLGLDAVIAGDAAAEPGVLPLLSFTLNAIYADDVERQKKNTLTHAAYSGLKGLKGAIATRAEQVFSDLPHSAQEALPRVLRSLAAVSSGTRAASDGAADTGPRDIAAEASATDNAPRVVNIVARSAPQAFFAAGTPQRTTVDKLIEARLLVASSEGSVPTVRLAHEALISHWKRAGDQLIGDRRDIETRDLIDQQRARWHAGEAALMRDPDLASAIDLEKRWGDELPVAIREFIAKSMDAAQRQRRRVRALVTGVIVILLFLTAASLGALYLAEVQRNNALIAQSDVLARESHTAVAAGNARNGIALALLGLPSSIARPSRPFVSAAEYALEDAFDNRRDRFVLAVPGGRVWTAAYTHDKRGRRIVTAHDDGSARVWDAGTGKLVLTLSGHKSRVWAAAFSPDDKEIATASDDHTARIWDAATGKILHVLDGHADAVSAVAFSPDGTRLVTASDDGTARIWDSQTGQLIHVLDGQGPITAVAFSPNDSGARVATASTDKIVRLWNAAGGTLIAKLTGHDGFINDLCFSPDGTRLVTASWDKTARVWTIGKSIMPFTADKPVVLEHENFVLAASFSRDGRRVVTASADNTAIVWDATNGKATAEIKGHEDWVTSAQFSPDDKRILTTSNDGTARLWNAENGSSNGVFRGHDGLLTSAAFSPDGNSIVTASYDQTARIWDTQPSDYVSAFTGHNSAQTVNSAAFSPDGLRVVTASDDKTAEIWDAATGEHALRLQLNGAVHSAVFSHNGKLIVTGSEVDEGGGEVRIWDAVNGREPVKLPRLDSQVWGAAFSHDDARVVAGLKDGTARIFDVKTGTLLVVLSKHSNVVQSVAFSPDDKRVLTSSWDWTARIWTADAAGKRPVTITAPLLIIKAHENRIPDAVWSEDGKFVLTASQDATARLWDASSGKLVRTFQGHENALNTAAFSPDGSRIVTSSNDLTARLWDVTSAVTIAVLRGHGDEVRDAEFSSDGKRVVTSSRDGTAQVWQMSPRCQALLDAANSQIANAGTSKSAAAESPAAPVLELLNRVLAPFLPKSQDHCE